MDFNLKTVRNKSNGQMNVSLPKKEIGKALNINPERIKSIRINIKGVDLW